MAGSPSPLLQTVLLDPRVSAQLSDLADYWQRMSDAIDSNRIDAHLPWLTANLDWISPGKNQLKMVVMLENGQPKAIFPLETRILALGPLRLKELGFLNHPAVPADACVFLANGDQTRIWETLGDLLRHRLRWHCLSLERITANGPFAHGVRAAAGNRVVVFDREPYPEYYIDAITSYEAYMKQHSRNYRRNLRRAHDIAQQMGTVQFSREPPPGQTVMQALADVDRRSWRMLKPDDVKKNQGILDYCERLAIIFPNTESQWIQFMSIGDQLIAAIFCIRTGNTLYGIKITYDDAFEQVSPGSLLLDWAIRECAATGVRRFEFQARNWYTKRIGNSTRYLSRDVLFHGKNLGWFAGHALRTARTVKRYVQRNMQRKPASDEAAVK